ncbi:hypothetical protein OEA41_008635 [Lepraria neglecta]|uniref:Uncharacterized protein n=1 Tax=Lepraria neglecta TaxID=209136 RepID=A0AAD9Z3G2_9LECA|nr:hypothetical protein OEA41_008635 [Lepraria neglecta]
MARFNISALLAATLAATSAHAAATCNIDGNTFETADASRACAAIPNQITLTGTTTLLAQSPTNPEITVILQQANVNWSGSGAAAQQLCNQIIQTCGGTIGVAEMNGASIPTGGDFGGPGTISITV